MFPTTRLDSALSNTKSKNPNNIQFYKIGTWMIKVFYVWAKHFMGFHINYLRFLGAITPREMKFVRGLWLLNAGTVSISVFLHTMRFKGLLPPRVTFSIYLVMAYASFIGGYHLLPLFVSQPSLVLLTTIGMLLNFWRGKQYILKIYFVVVAVILTFVRSNYELVPEARFGAYMC